MFKTVLEMGGPLVTQPTGALADHPALSRAQIFRDHRATARVSATAGACSARCLVVSALWTTGHSKMTSRSRRRLLVSMRVECVHPPSRIFPRNVWLASRRRRAREPASMVRPGDGTRLEMSYGRADGHSREGRGGVSPDRRERPYVRGVGRPLEGGSGYATCSIG